MLSRAVFIALVPPPVLTKNVSTLGFPLTISATCLAFFTISKYDVPCAARRLMFIESLS